MDLNLQLDQFSPNLRIRRIGEQRQIFDRIREKWLVLQPEEFVRQLLVNHCVEVAAYPANRLVLERGLQVEGVFKRTDLLILHHDLTPFLLAECKAPQVPVTQDTLRQAAMYNLSLQVDYLMVTNGRNSYCCKMNYQERSFLFLEQLPIYPATRNG